MQICAIIGRSFPPPPSLSEFDLVEDGPLVATDGLWPRLATVYEFLDVSLSNVAFQRHLFGELPISITGQRMIRVVCDFLNLIESHSLQLFSLLVESCDPNESSTVMATLHKLYKQVPNCRALLERQMQSVLIMANVDRLGNVGRLLKLLHP